MKDPATKLTGEQVCEMVKIERVEELFEVAIEDTTPVDIDNRAFKTASCHYDTVDNDALEEISLAATISYQGVTGKKAVDEAFQSVEPRKQGKYETVEGLGDHAGFGPEMRNADAVGPGEKLFVVENTESDGVSYWVHATVEGDATLKQLRPLAETVLKQWERE